MRDVPGCLIYFFLISLSLIVSSPMKIPCETVSYRVLSSGYSS